jgi:pyruvate kinase
MDVARLNFSHGTYEEHAEYIRRIREAAKNVGKKIPIIQDLSGPREKISGGHQFHEGAVKAITEKDKKDLAFGLSQKINYVCLSYVGSAEDVKGLKSLIKKAGEKTPVIAKVERQVALDKIAEIVKAADAIMLGRGDLGQAIPMERLPFAQHLVIQACNKAKKPVIVATEMMLSMVENSRPTRAEVNDVAHAILDGADAVMLSEESAIGKYPVETISMMDKIVHEAEGHLKKKKFYLL